MEKQPKIELVAEHMLRKAFRCVFACVFACSIHILQIAPFKHGGNSINA